jgi:hypothetical protein
VTAEKPTLRRSNGYWLCAGNSHASFAANKLNAYDEWLKDDAILAPYRLSYCVGFSKQIKPRRFFQTWVSEGDRFFEGWALEGVRFQA